MGFRQRQNLCLLLATLLFGTLMVVSGASPVFGILTQPIQDSNETMIAASYVKWLEAGGARSIPIPYDASEDMVQELFGQMDGILFPGGASDLPPSAVYLWKLLRHAYARGDAIPLWGTCLGFEFLLQLASQDVQILESGFQAENMSLPLETVLPYRLYRPTHIQEMVQTRNITMNNHHQGISPERFLRNPELSKLWKITSTNHDAQGRPFVSTIEPVLPNHLFPVFGVQFHPEKNAFEYASYPHTNIPYEAIDHSEEGIAMSLYMARFVVDLALKNPSFGKYHRYDKPDKYPLVYSYPMDRGIKFEQTFRVPPASSWSKSVNTDISKA